MPIQVKLFAGLRERAGWSERPVTPESLPATPLSLWLQLQLPSGEAAMRATPAQGHAAAAPGPQIAAAADHVLPEGIRVAINQTFASPDTPLADGDELAFLPPISGG